MKITVLAYQESERGKPDDPAVDQVAAALKQGGHKVSVFGIHGDVKKLLAGLARRKPDLVFNLMETFGESELGAVGLTGLLELLGFPYTGVGPGEYFLQTDKVLTKKLLAFDKVPFPNFGIFSQDADLETGGNLRMPLFVKPLRMESSIGIDGKSLVNTPREMMERVLKIHKECHDDALAEEYIEGRELFVGILGNHREATAFPPVEIDYSGMPEGKPHILDAKAKWDTKSPEYKGTKSVLANLEPEQKAKVEKVALDAYRALRVADYGRIDLRLSDTGDVYVIEVNASCYLEKTSEFAMAAAAGGVEYPDLINRIVEAAASRYKQRTGTKKTRALQRA
jgi:D-alanine-D-alanine ligase